LTALLVRPGVVEYWAFGDAGVVDKNYAQIASSALAAAFELVVIFGLLAIFAPLSTCFVAYFYKLVEEYYSVEYYLTAAVGSNWLVWCTAAVEQFVERGTELQLSDKSFADSLWLAHEKLLAEKKHFLQPQLEPVGKQRKTLVVTQV